MIHYQYRREYCVRVIRLWIRILSAFLALTVSWPTAGQSLLDSNDDFLSAQEAFQYDIQENTDGTLTLAWEIAPEYYLYLSLIHI